MWINNRYVDWGPTTQIVINIDIEDKPSHTSDEIHVVLKHKDQEEADGHQIKISVMELAYMRNFIDLAFKHLPKHLVTEAMEDTELHQVPGKNDRLFEHLRKQLRNVPAENILKSFTPT